MISAQRPVACALTCAGVSFRSDASPLRLIGPTERDKPPSIGNTRTQRSKYDLRPTTGRVRFNMRRRFVRAQTSDLFMARRETAFSVAVGKCALSSAAYTSNKLQAHPFDTFDDG